MDAQLAGSTVQHRVDELVSVRRAEAASEPHRLADHDPEGHFQLRPQLLQADQQNRVLDRVQLRRGPVAPGGEPGVELTDVRADRLDEAPEVFTISLRRILGQVEVSQQVLPRAGIELPAVKALQGELASDGAPRAGPREPRLT